MDASRSFALKRLALALLSPCWLLALAACGPSSSRAPVAAAPQQVKVEKDITFGPGSFHLGDTEAGLADLSSYVATLRVSFDGTRAGKAEIWSKTYTMHATRQPLARHWTIEQSANGSAADTVLQAEMNGLYYEKHGQDSCNAGALPQEDLPSESYEPAAFLSGVIGAEEVGTEDVNDIPTTHYSFDQRALGTADVAQSTGEMWVASEGAYVVKYLLTTTAGPDHFGAGVGGTLSMEYALTGPNAALTIALPEDCPPGLVNAPALPDATNVENLPGLLAFDTATPMAEAVAFYTEQLPPLGWSPQGDPLLAEAAAMLIYTSGDVVATITIEKADGQSHVTIFSGPGQPMP